MVPLPDNPCPVQVPRQVPTRNDILHLSIIHLSTFPPSANSSIYLRSSNLEVWFYPGGKKRKRDERKKTRMKQERKKVAVTRYCTIPISILKLKYKKTNLEPAGPTSRKHNNHTIPYHTHFNSIQHQHKHQPGTEPEGGLNPIRSIRSVKMGHFSHFSLTGADGVYDIRLKRGEGRPEYKIRQYDNTSNTTGD